MTATGIGLSVLGSGLQAREQASNQKRMTRAGNQAYQEGMDRQRRHSEEASAEMNRNIVNQGRDAFDENRENEAERITQAFDTRRTQPDYNVASAGNLPKNVILAREAASKKAAGETDRDVENLSNLSGYGGALFNQDLSRSDFARLFGNIQSKAGADARLLPNEISAAQNNAQKAPGLFPTLLTTVGSGLSMYGAANPGASFFDKVVEGPLPLSGIGPGAPVTQPGLFSTLQNKVLRF